VGKEAVNTVEKIVFDTILGNSSIENVVENRISEGITNVKNKIKNKRINNKKRRRDIFD
jgi:hypothetical protein